MNIQGEIKLLEDLERSRANFAYKCVKEAIGKFGEKSETLKEYRSYLRKIPSMVLNNGLGQTLAFIKSKSKGGNAYDIILKQLTNYFKSHSPARIRITQDDILLWAISLSSEDYRFVTEELLSLINWMKRFAEGMIESD
ncbi:MAG: type III-B CRISPR module-associated protein Cmr5 [candidate division WOR-3 bacterium]